MPDAAAISKLDLAQSADRPVPLDRVIEGDAPEDVAPKAQHGTQSLCEALDRILATGIVARGDLTISVAGVDLIYLGLGALLASVDRVTEPREAGSEPLESTAAA
ncbi:MAG: gas vesicle protein [Planctomycetota bacterium]